MDPDDDIADIFGLEVEPDVSELEDIDLSDWDEE